MKGFVLSAAGMMQVTLLLTLCSSQLTPEQRRVANQLRIEFEVNGVHLTPELREKAVALHEHISEVSYQFMQAINAPPETKSFLGENNYVPE